MKNILYIQNHENRENTYKILKNNLTSHLTPQWLCSNSFSLEYDRHMITELQLLW